MNELKKIKNLKELKTLVADGNPLCDNYQNSSNRICEVFNSY